MGYDGYACTRRNTSDNRMIGRQFHAFEPGGDNWLRNECRFNLKPMDLIDQGAGCSSNELDLYILIIVMEL